jgi:predicted Zn-ribbon and HTH transcriptional regulator
MKNIRVFRFEECKRCGWKWIPRLKVPVLCPKCKNPYWNIERKTKK